MSKILFILLLLVIGCGVPEHSAYIYNDPTFKGGGAEPEILFNDSDKYIRVVIKNVIFQQVIDTVDLVPSQRFPLGNNMFRILDQWEIEPFDEGQGS